MDEVLPRAYAWSDHAPTAWSLTARHLASAISRIVARLDRPVLGSSNVTDVQRWDHFEQILAQMRDDLRAAGVTFVVALIPDRAALEATDPTTFLSYGTRQRVDEISVRLGIRTLDAWDLFAAAVRSDGAARYFLWDNDIHLSPEGHRLYADWLAQHLLRVGQTSPR